MGMSVLDRKDKPIGLFDSGVGGISVLKEAISMLPNENFVYFGDSKNAPYGTKTVEQIQKLSFQAVEFLLEKEAKAVVVACNTATSAVIEQLRQQYSYMPIIGIEPALKPAVELREKGKILIMATPVTLAEVKFGKLMDAYSEEAEIQPLPCPGLADLIEKGNFESVEVKDYLANKLAPYLNEDIAAIVLGCTHYPFVKKQILAILNKEVTIIDGSMGTAKQLKRQLEGNNLLSDRKESGTVEIYNSFKENKEIIDLSYRLLEY